MNLLLIAIGGALGSVARYLFSSFVLRATGSLLPIGTFAVGNTGGWDAWKTIPANISNVSGTHDVYVTFTSGQPAPYVSVNWVKFGT